MALSTQVRASSSNIGTAFSWKYDVFLSFRGADTRKGFTGHLYHKLQWQGIKTFRDDPDLERGTVISPELLSAIEQSRFAVVVLSPNYASSKWCLFELCKILQCMDESGRVLPIFYEVDPTDVRHQTGSFAKAFKIHKKKEDGKEVKGWRQGLTQVANLAGWSSKDYGYETDLIKEIVQTLWTKVHPSLTLYGSSESLVGMDTMFEEIKVLLVESANDVGFIGIWGMAGVGKTTLAGVVYERISHHFDVGIFLTKVREVSATHGLKQIISKVLKDKNVQVWDEYSGITMAERCLCDKAVLLVLDDVEQSEQLEKLAKKGWFGSGSRIIITTRNRHVLVTHGIATTYEMRGLHENAALQLFSWNAFRKYEPEEDYAELSNCFVRYAGGHPLALKTLGSTLYQKSLQLWSSALEKLRKIPNKTVFDFLKLSYDALDNMEKETFLDITCYSSQCGAKFITELLYSFDDGARFAVDVLVEKSLLTISADNEIGIHDLLQEMGCEIVRQESYKEPGRRSRLWLRKDIFHVFTKNTGTEAIEGIILLLPKLEEATCNLEAFSKMCSLKLLYLDNLRLSSGPEHLSDYLRYLNWSWFPSKSLPQGFQPDELTELTLIHSNIDHLWVGIKYLSKLKSIDLSHSINLTRTPDFTGMQNLEKLVLEGCTNLVTVHSSIEKLRRLKIWNFRNCRSLESLPSKVEMECLETFDVSGCSRLKMVPEFLGQMKRLSKVCVNGTAIAELSSSFEHLSPHPLSSLLDSLKHFTALTTLNLSECNLSEGDIPNDIGSLSSLRNLELRGNNFVTLPASFHLLSKLEKLYVDNCKRLQQLPVLPSNDELDVYMDNCTALQVFPDPPKLCREYWLSCVNCLSTVDNHYSYYFLYSVLKRLLEERPCSFVNISFVIPGSEIVEWFNNQTVGDSVTEKLPLRERNSKWIGFAVCALFVPENNSSAVPEDDRLNPDQSQILCTWNGSYILTGFGSLVGQIVSDHLFLVVVPSHLWNPVDDPWNDVIKFGFETTRAVGSNRCIKVKKCGARALYEHDMEELISKMNQARSSISTYEATGVMVKATHEAARSQCGGSDDEYYSAEE